jgi:hypothetical protein
MAETFKNQVDALTGFAGTEDDALSDWLTAGAKEIINILPKRLKVKCGTVSLLNADNGTTLDMDGRGEILYVTRENADSGYYAPCREIPAMFGDLSNDSTNIMYYATATDPVYWIESNSSNASTLFTKPTPTNNQPAKVVHIAYPAVAHGDTAIANFPDEAEYLVVIYASIKALQRLMNNINTNSDITTALTAMNTELDETQAVCDLINTQIDSAVAEVLESVTLIDTNIDTATSAITTALGRVNTAVALANTEFDLVNPEVDLANTAVDDDDLEKASGYIATANGYSQAGGNYINEAQASLAEAQGYIAEVNARIAQTGGQVNIASGYLNAAQGYLSELQAKVSISNAYGAEAQARLQHDSQKYTWYQGQQTKLQQDYDRGLQLLITGSTPENQRQREE